MNQELEKEVRRRAGDRCEYCHLPEIHSPFKHWIDHIVAKQHSGPTTFENLALSCGDCNRRKGTNLSGVDPATGNIVLLFNPRSQTWNDHFRWNGALLVGLTETGRATIQVLGINREPQIELRQALIDTGQFSED